MKEKVKSIVVARYQIHQIDGQSSKITNTKAKLCQLSN